MLKVKVLIAAYNAEKNIENILRSLVRQRSEDILINKIVVYSDWSKDSTVVNARKIKDKRIEVVEGKARKGFAGVVAENIQTFDSNIIIILNDDIKIYDEKLIDKLVKPFINESKVGLVTGNPRPIKSINFIENAIISTSRAYENMRYSFGRGSNLFTCDGKVMALSKEFIRSLSFPKDYKNTGNVDVYLYFSCLRNGFKHRHVRGAEVYFKMPSTVADYLKWTTRNNSNYFILKRIFGDIVEKEYRMPKKIYWFMFLEFLKNPLGCTFIYLVGIYAKLIARSSYKDFNPLWDTVGTTKGAIG